MTRRGVQMGLVPKSVGPGRVLCHNHVQHTARMPSGENGFRGWTDTKPPPNFVKCPCGWSGLHRSPKRVLAAGAAAHGKAREAGWCRRAATPD
jgi:hypothetical protein